MIKVSFVLFLVFLAGNARAEDSAFVYDNHGKRDPFAPLVSSKGSAIVYDGDITSADMILEGIVADPKGDNMAIVNGKIVKTTDRIGPYLVENIGNNQVELSNGQDRFTLKLKEGGT